MSKSANPTKIGLFIVVGLFLGVAGVIIFSSARLFSSTETYVLYFDASVKGLNVGAPVKLRGVTVGSVEEILIRFNQAQGDLHMPVIVKVNEDLLREKTQDTINLSKREDFQAIINEGLRGMLQAQSFVTGLLYVELDILPDAPPPVFHQTEMVYKEIPTAPTEIQQLLENLAKVDINGITEKLNTILARLETSLDQLQVAQISQGVTNLLGTVNLVVKSSNITNLIATATGALEEIQGFSATARAKVDPLADQLQAALANARQAMAELQGGAGDLRDMIDPEAPLRRELVAAIDELARTARAISTLADFLTRNPDALISGRKPQNRLSR